MLKQIDFKKNLKESLLFFFYEARQDKLFEIKISINKGHNFIFKPKTLHKKQVGLSFQK